MLSEVKETIEKYKMLSKGDTVVVGLSGGADSVCLLFLLRELGLNIAAVHVNHGLRGGESDGDEKFVRELCKGLGVELDVYSFDLNAEASAMGLSVEEAGRQLRYICFDKTAARLSASKVAVAHNKNDNAETVLMRIIRGTGLKGLKGIPPVRGNIIRPLIESSRDEIEGYCKAKGLSYCTDSTNLEDVYTRNKIRLSLLPVMEEINPDAINAIARMSQLIADEDQVLENITLAAGCVDADGSIIIDKLRELPRPLMRRAVRQAFSRCTNHLKDISFEHGEMVLSLADKESGKRVRLPNRLYAERSYGRIKFGKVGKEDTGFFYSLPMDTVVEVPEAGIRLMASKKPPVELRGVVKQFDLGKINGELVVRSRQAGDKIFVTEMGGTKKLKDYFIDTKLPRDKRDKVALLTCGNDILWVMDEKNIISGAYKGSAAAEKTLYIQKWEV